MQPHQRIFFMVIGTLSLIGGGIAVGLNPPGAIMLAFGALLLLASTSR